MDDVSTLAEMFQHGNHAIAIAAIVVIYRQAAKLDTIDAKLKIVLKKLGLS
jgi:hypothetical protein